MGVLRLSLSDPAFGYLERLGVAGIALALDAAERDGAALGALEWDVSQRDVTLRWPEDTLDGDALMPLIEFAWSARNSQIDGGLGVLFFPGIHRGAGKDNPLQRYVEHAGVLGTFLQHPRSQPKTKPQQFQMDLGDDKIVRVQMVEPTGRLLHPGEARSGLFKKGRLFPGRVEFSSFLVPGATGRYAKEASWSGTSVQAFALIFAPTAAYYLSLERAGWAVVIPDVTDLVAFRRLRPHATLDFSNHRAGNAADAGLATLVRLKLSHVMVGLDATQRRPTRCEVIQVGRVVWNKQNVRRMRIELTPGELELDQFEALTRWLPNRFQQRKGDQDGFIRIPTPRGLIATNLVAGRPWYHRLFEVPSELREALEARRKGASKSAGMSLERVWFYELARFYRKELNGIMKEISMQSSDRAFVDAFHQALRRLYGREADAAGKGGGRSVTERLEDLTEEIRRRLERSQTRPLLRESIASLFARAGRTEALQRHREVIWNLIDDEREWMRARDLALLALASYQRPNAETDEPVFDDEGQGAELA